MKLFRIVCWLLFPLCIGTIQSCCSCDTINYNYGITAMHAVNLDNSGKTAIVAGSDSVKKNAYGIRVSWTTTKVAYEPHPSTLFMSSAYASDLCNCQPFFGIPKDSIQDFKIITMNDFDSAYMANSDITAYFYEDGRRPVNESFLLGNRNFFYTMRPDSIAMNCLLMHAPALPSLQQFRIDIDFTNGKNFSVLTNPVILY